jgi:hypothetical protein
MRKRKMLKFSQDIWPWEFIGTDQYGKVLPFVAIKRNGLTYVQVGRDYEEVDERIWSLQKSIECAIKAISKSTHKEILQAKVKSGKINRYRLRDLHLKSVHRYSQLLISILITVMESPSGLSRRRLRNILGGRYHGEEVDLALNNLLQGGLIKLTEKKHYRMSGAN